MNLITECRSFHNSLKLKGFFVVLGFWIAHGIIQCWNNGILGIKAEKIILIALNSSKPIIPLFQL